MFIEQKYNGSKMSNELAACCQISDRDKTTGLLPDPIGCLQRIDLTDFKFRAALYHGNRILNLGENQELLFEMNAFIMEIRGVWDLVFFEIAHYYCFYHDLKPKFDKSLFLKSIKSADKGLLKIIDDILHGEWFKALTAIRNYIIHQGALLGNVEMILGEGVPIIEKTLLENEFLRKTDFREFEHNKPEYLRARVFDYYNKMVESIDLLREYAIKNSLLFNKTIWKRHIT